MKETIQFGHGAGQHPDADQISAFAEHALPAHEREEMLAHLAVCPECRATVRMSQTAVEEAGEPAESAKRRPWFAGWAVALPLAGALAALVVFAMYLRHTAVVRQTANEPSQMAESEKPERPEMEERPESNPTQEAPAKNAEKAGKSPGAAGEIAKKNSDSKRLRAPEPGRFLQSNAVPAPFLGNAPMAQAASPMATPAAAAPQTRAAGAMRQTLQAGIGGPREVSNGALASVVLDQLKVEPVLQPLPSGLPVLSSATRGRQVVAIDARNSVFASADGGVHWTMVPGVWTGRAVKADLVSYGTIGGSAAGGIAEFASTNRVAQQAQANRAPVPSGTVQPGTGLTGTVKDASGAAVGGATVTVTDGAGRAAGAATANQAGEYRVEGLAPGMYDVTTQAPGFEPQTTKGVEVKQSQATVAHVALKVGAANEAVEVSEADAVQTAPAKALAKSAAKPDAPIFALTTDNGEQWTSADGMTWKRK
jgi:hypothetical protein